MEDQKDKQCRIIFYSQFSSYLLGVPLILTMTVLLDHHILLNIDVGINNIAMILFYHYVS